MADDEFFGGVLGAPSIDQFQSGSVTGSVTESSSAAVVGSKESSTAAAQDLKLFDDEDMGDEDPFGLNDPTSLPSNVTHKGTFVPALRPTLSPGQPLSSVGNMDAAGKLLDQPVSLQRGTDSGSGVLAALGVGLNEGQNDRQSTQNSATNEPPGLHLAAVAASHAKPQSNTVEPEPARGPSWMELTDPAGRVYYFNERTNESRWDRPAEVNVEGLVNPWEELEDSYGRAYFFNTITEESRWTKPAEMVQDERRLALQERQAQARQQQQEEEQMVEQQRRQIVEARARALSVATAAMPLRNNIASAFSAESNGLPSLPDSDSAVDASWRSSTDCEGRTYYYNMYTQESVWQRPLSTPPRLNGAGSHVSQLSESPTCAQRPQQQEPTPQQLRTSPGNHQQLAMTDNPEDLARRNVPHCVATFGFGGLLATSTVETKQRSAFADTSARHTTVTVSLLASGKWATDPWIAVLVDSPGPLSLTTPKEKLLAWITSQRMEISAYMGKDDVEQTEKLLWAYLLHLVRQDGSLYPVEAFATQVQKMELGNSWSTPLPDSADLTLAQSRVPTDGNLSDIHATTARVERLLKDGNFKAACQVRLSVYQVV
jgi:hypothetical protein